MASTQYPVYPMTDWSGEISGMPQPTAHASTTTTTTTTSTASAGQQHFPGAVPQTTTMTTNTSAAPAQTAAPVQSAASGAAGAPAAATASPAAQQSALPVPTSTRNEFQGATGTLDLETHQPLEVVEAPATMNEAFLGSMKSMLLRNRGSFVTATFLIGTQGTSTWEGILHDVGNDHLIIFQPGRQRYIACDLYALKYIEFYDTRERDACRQLLRQSDRNGQMNYGQNSFY